MHTTEDNPKISVEIKPVKKLRSPLVKMGATHSRILKLLSVLSLSLNSLKPNANKRQKIKVSIQKDMI